MQKYITYKDSIKKIVSSIPNHWKSHRAKDVFDSIDVRSAAGQETLLSVSEHRGVVPRNEMKITMFMAESYEGYKLCEEGDIVINSLWAWGRGIGVSEYSGIVSTAYGVFRPRNENQFNPSYLNYLLRTKDYVGLYFMRSKGIWISRLQLQDKNFLDLPIICPSKEEQDEIVQHIKAQEEKINQFIQKKRRFIDLLKEQRQSIINDKLLINSKLCKLKFCVTKVGSGVTPKGGGEVYQDEGILFLRSQNVHNDGLRLEGIACISEEINSEMKGSEVQLNDVLINVTGASIGRCFVFNKNERANVNQHVCIIRPKQEIILSEFLMMQIQSEKIQTIIDMVEGASREGLTNHDIKNFYLFVPTLEEQKIIIDDIKTETKTIDTTIAKAEREIELIREYKEAMISEAVMGKRNINLHHNK